MGILEQLASDRRTARIETFEKRPSGWHSAIQIGSTRMRQPVNPARRITFLPE